MTRGLTLSVALHIVLIVFTIIGLPQLFQPKPLEDRLMVVDVVTVGSITNAPPPAEAAEKPDAPKQTAKARPDSPKTPPPPPSAAPPPPPPPTPKIEPPKVEAPQAAVPKVEPPKAQTARSAQVQPGSQAEKPAPAPAPKAPSAEAVPAPKPETLAAAEPVPAPKPEPVPTAKPQEVGKPDPQAVPLPTPKPEETRKPEPAAVPVPTPKPEEAKKPDPEPEKPKPAEAAKPEAPKAEPTKPEPETVKAADASPTPPPPVPVSRPTPPKKTQTAARETPPAPEDKKTPEQNDDFLNVLKTVQRMKQTASAPAETDKSAPQTTDSTARRSNFDADRPLSVSEMDAIRQQIARCWLVPAGAKEGESLAVEIRVRMNPDRTVREAEVVESGRMRSDPFFRAAAESALRALRNPSCTPLNLPPEKYETWKSFTITFDPRDMLS